MTLVHCSGKPAALYHRPAMSAEMPDPPPSAEIAARIAAFQASLRSNGLDGAMLVQAADLVYLTATAQNAHLLVPADGDPVLLVRRDLERAQSESPLARVEPMTSLRALPEAARSVGIEAGARLGLELDAIPAAAYLRYRDLFADAEIVDCMPSLWPVRARKSPWELERIDSACRQSRAAMDAAPALLQPGRAEADVLTDLGGVMRAHGHEGTIRFRGMNAEFYFGQVLAGENATIAGPSDTPLHGPGLSSAQGRGPGRRALRAGDSVVIDVSGLCEGYVSDQTRTFFVGEPEPRAARRLRGLSRAAVGSAPRSFAQARRPERCMREGSSWRPSSASRRRTWDTGRRACASSGTESVWS